MEWAGEALESAGVCDDEAWEVVECFDAFFEDLCFCLAVFVEEEAICDDALYLECLTELIHGDVFVAAFKNGQEHGELTGDVVDGEGFRHCDGSIIGGWVGDNRRF